MYIYIHNPVNSNVTDGKITILHGKTRHFDWAIFNSYVELPEGICI